MKSIFLFPLFALIFSVLAFYVPEWFTPHKQIIIPLLGVIMFGMGITLRLGDFVSIIQRPKVIGLGLILQFGLMPLFAFLLANCLSLSTELLIGLVLVGACPGGTASNVICYLAKGDVALSIFLTTMSTMLAMVLTPILTWLYIGQMVHVPILDMMNMIMMIIMLPVALGILLNRLFGSSIHWLKTVFPVLSMAAIVLIIAIIVALNQTQIQNMVLTVMLVVIVHNVLGLASAYLLAKSMGYSVTVAKTLAIEVGMQNSGLAVALATKFFPAIAALPAVVFSIWHNLSGAVLASYWSRTPDNNKIQASDD